MRIVVIGGAGMLGHKMFQILRERFPETVCTTREDVRKPPFDRVELLQGDDVIRGVDVMDFDRLHGTLKELRPDFIVNCVGIVKKRSLTPMKVTLELPDEWAASFPAKETEWAEVVTAGLHRRQSRTRQEINHFADVADILAELPSPEHHCH